MIYFCILALFVYLVCYAAYSDAKSLIIENRICISLLVLWPAFLILTSHPIDIPFSVVAALVSFFIGFVLWYFNKIGAGDVKFLAVTMLYATTPETAIYFAAGSFAIAIAYAFMFFSPWQYNIVYVFGKLGLLSVYDTISKRVIPVGVGIGIAALTIILPTLI